jgi:hypothetical protein
VQILFQALVKPINSEEIIDVSSSEKSLDAALSLVATPAWLFKLVIFPVSTVNVPALIYSTPDIFLVDGSLLNVNVAEAIVGVDSLT